MDLDLDKVKRELERFQFAEFNLWDSWKTKIHLQNGDVKSVSSGQSLIYSFRVVVNSIFGMASSTDPARWMETLKMAEKMARTSESPVRYKLSDEDVFQDKWVVRPRVSLNEGIDFRVKRIREIHRELSIPSRVKKVDINLFDAMYKQVYVNSQGSEIYQSFPRAVLSIRATAKHGIVVTARDAVGGLYGLEIFDMFDSGQSVLDRANALLRSKRAPSGKHTVILDPDMAGVLAHEAIGHACEADAVLMNASILSDKVGEKIGSELVTIVDDATLPRAYGSYGYDAEGVPGQRTVLVEEGVLKGFMHSKETASEFGLKSTGNARFQDPSHTPLVRMSNTFFEAGDSSLDEIIEETKFGVVVSRMKGGVTDPNSGYFQFAAEYGYLVENGEKTKMLRDVVISGNFLEMLHKVDMVADDLKVSDIGTCGKSGQGVPVGDGGPHMRVKGVLVG